MTFTRSDKATDAAQVAATKAANHVQAYMEWEMVNEDGTEILNEDGAPVLRSDKDIALWGTNGQYKSKADQCLIVGAKKKAETDEYLEVYLKVKVKAYTPKAAPKEEDVLGIFGLAA